MATKKQTKTKKASAAKRPPKQLWAVVDGKTGELVAGRTSRLIAKTEFEGCADVFIAGPYVLAERVRNR